MDNDFITLAQERLTNLVNRAIDTDDPELKDFLLKEASEFAAALDSDDTYFYSDDLSNQ